MSDRERNVMFLGMRLYLLLGLAGGCVLSGVSARWWLVLGYFVLFIGLTFRDIWRERRAFAAETPEREATRLAYLRRCDETFRRDYRPESANVLFDEPGLSVNDERKR